MYQANRKNILYSFLSFRPQHQVELLTYFEGCISFPVPYWILFVKSFQSGKRTQDVYLPGKLVADKTQHIASNSRSFISAFTLILMWGILPFQANAQQILNLDFEGKSVRGLHLPWGWDAVNITAIALLDSLKTHEGKYSLKIVADGSQATDGTQIMQFNIEPYELQNKRITIEGWIKTESLNGAAFFTIGYTSEAPVFSESVSDDVVTEVRSEEISHTTDWHPVSLNLQIPESIHSAFISVRFEGTGTAWFDAFSLSINGETKQDVEVAESFSESQVTWLSDSSHPVYYVDTTPAGKDPSYDDLVPLKSLAGDAQIIALGEATHGTSEFFRMKHRVLEYSVFELGVRIFAIEDHPLIVERVNKYEKGSAGTARASMYGMLGVWQTEEVHNLIKWIRQYNNQHPDDMVEFTGFDIQNITVPVDSLYSFVQKQSPDLFKEISGLLEDLKSNGPNSFAVSDSVKLNWFLQAEETLELLSSRKKSWLESATDRQDSLDVYWGIQYATLIKQFAENVYRGHLSLYRDIAMAENVSWLLDVYKPGAKMLIWAHDYHISRGDHPEPKANIYDGNSMGAHLSQKYGDKYKAFGLFTYQGYYWAFPSYFNFSEMLDCPLYPGPRGSLDEALHRIASIKNAPALFLDLAGGRKQDWLVQSIPQRFANHVCMEYSYWTQYSIPYQFDGIFFIDTTTSAKSYARNK